MAVKVGNRMTVRLTLVHYCLAELSSIGHHADGELLFPTLLFCGSFRAHSTDVPPSSLQKRTVASHSELIICRHGLVQPPCLVRLTFLDVPVKSGHLGVLSFPAA